MILYKLTERDSTTYNRSMRWAIGETNKLRKCKDPQLCTGDVIHAYRDLDLALIMNPAHANITDPRIYKCEGEIAVEEPLKCGVFALTPIEELSYPQWYISSKKNDVLLKFAILCAESVLHIFEEKYPDDNRPREAIEAAKEYLNTKTKKSAEKARAAYAAAREAAREALAAADAAYAAADAADAAYAAADAAYAVADAADAAAIAADAACVATSTADAADAAKIVIDFSALAKQAISEIMGGIAK